MTVIAEGNAFSQEKEDGAVSKAWGEPSSCPAARAPAAVVAAADAVVAATREREREGG